MVNCRKLLMFRGSDAKAQDCKSLRTRLNSGTELQVTLRWIQARFGTDHSKPCLSYRLLWIATIRCGKIVNLYPSKSNRIWSGSLVGENIALSRRRPRVQVPSRSPIWSLRLSVRTRDFQSCKRSSTLLGITNMRRKCYGSTIGFHPVSVGSTPTCRSNIAVVAQG